MLIISSAVECRKVLSLFWSLSFLSLASASASCNKEDFLAHIAEGSSSCRSCYFPSQSGNVPPSSSPLDLSNKWVYFAGDSTLRQFYGEFYGIIHRTQVLPACLYEASC